MKKAFIIFSLFLNFYSQAQNLVPNYSFEDTLHCPDNGDQLNLAFPWYSPTNASPDYFNQCGLAGYVGVPSNFLGLQNAKTGQAYAGLVAYGTSGLPYREYIQVQLTSPLVNGKNYCVSFNVNLSDVNPTYTKVAITEMGLLFSSNAVTSTNLQPLPYVPQITSASGFYLSDTSEWIEITGIYSALGGEEYITIGNFKDDINTDTLVLLDSSTPQAYYYVDDVSVTECDTSSGINETQKDYGISMYPNPNNGNMTVEYHLTENENAQLTIYNVTGKLMKRVALNSKATVLNLHETSLQAGMYYYSITVNNKVVKTEKLIIIK